MKFKVNWTAADSVFAVPDCVVDDYLKLANGKSIKVLLYILKNKNVDTSDCNTISKSLGISVEDTEDAFSYWEQVGIIYKENAVPVKLTEARTTSTETKELPTPHTNANTEKERFTKMLTPAEIADHISKSQELSFLFSGVEAILGRILTHTEQRSLIWIHEYYGLGADLILMIAGFCKSIDKANIGFIEKIACSWNDSGISTHEQAENEILRLQKYYSLAGKIVSRLELNRSLTPKERELVDNWAAADTDIELICYAYEKTIASTGKVTFSYMNKIILEWNKNNLKTIPEIERFDEQYRLNQKKTAVKPNNTPKSFSAEHSYNLQKIAEYAMNNTPKIEEDTVK